MARRVFKKRLGKRRFGKRMSRPRNMVSIMGKPITRKLDTDFFVYYTYHNTSGNNAYSFSVSPSVNPTVVKGILDSLEGELEFKNLAISYGFIKIHGFLVSIKRALNAAVSTIYTVPEFSIGIDAYNFATNAANNFDQDNNLKYQALQSTQGVSKYFKIPGPVVSSIGYPLGGVWSNARDIHTGATDGNWYLALGYVIAPTSAATADLSVLVATVNVTAYVQYAMPHFVTTI